MTRIKSILAAGTLTGLVLITLLALGFRSTNAQNNTDTGIANPTLTAPTTTDGAMAVQAWQDYTSQLEDTVRTLQQRESQYQTQLDAANQAILQMQDSINQANNAPTFTGGHEYEEHEHEEHDDYDD